MTQPTTAPPDGSTTPAAPPTPPVPSAPQVDPPAPQPPATEPPKPGPPAEKTFTQADLDRILNERLTRQEKALTDKFAKVFGIGGDDVDPAKALEQAQQAATAAREQAVGAVAEALALKAGIDPKKVDTFVLIAKQAGLFKEVDLSADGSKTALEAAITAKAGEFPEWKAVAVGALPSSSGGDRTPPSGGKRVYTRAELEKMSPDELAKNADDLMAAAAEGRIK